MALASVTWLDILVPLLVNLIIGYLWLKPHVSKLVREPNESSINWFRRSKGVFVVLAFFLLTFSLLVDANFADELDAIDIDLTFLGLALILSSNLITLYLMDFGKKQESGINFLFFFALSTLILVGLG